MVAPYGMQTLQTQPHQVKYAYHIVIVFLREKVSVFPDSSGTTLILLKETKFTSWHTDNL